MKHKYLALLSAALFASCGNNATPYSLDLVAATPAGAPAVAFYKHLGSDKLEVNADPANVVAYMTDGSKKDVLVLPTNAGLAAITKKSAPYQIAATLTFGNFYLASTGKDDNDAFDQDDYVVVFQQKNVPDKIFQYVYGDKNLTNVHYVTAASDAARCLITSKNESDNNAEVKYVLMAEPALSTALGKNKAAKEYANIQTEFAKKSGGKEITQASIFVHKEADKTKVNAFLKSTKEDVEAFLKTPTVLDEALKGIDADVVSSKLGASAETLKTMASNNNRMGLGFKNAYQNKEAIENFVSLFGIKDLNEEVYYK